MRRFLTLFFVLFSYHILFAQSIKPSYPTPKTTADIDRIIKKVANKDVAETSKNEKQLLDLVARSEEFNYPSGMLQSGNILMWLYSLQNRNEEVVDLGNKLKKIAEKQEKDPKGIITNIYRRNALALGLLGLDDASFKDFKTAIRYAETVEDDNKRFYLLATCYENITGYYISEKFQGKDPEDSVTYYLNRSLEIANKVKDNNNTVSNQNKYDHIAFVNMRLGIEYLSNTDIKGNLGLAEEYLLRALAIYKRDESNILPNNKALLMNQLSWLYLEKKDFNTSIDYANRALELEKKYPHPYHRVESFEFLASSYLEKGEKDKSKFYMDKYTYLKDSINLMTRKQADDTMKKMVAEVDTEHQENSRKQLIIIGVLILFALIITVILWRRKNRILRRNYEQIIEKLKQNTLDQPAEVSAENEETDDYKDIEPEANGESKLPSNRNVISAETETRILKRLAAFEKSEKFLRKDFSLGLLAAQLNTNSKYLSEVIKNNRAQNFNNYINTLRINYIIRKLYNEAKYREYKISYLAEECGYASSQVFVIAFKKINGVTPSYFIDSLKEDQSLVYS